MRARRSKKKSFNLYNLTVFICVAVILVSLYVLFSPGEYIMAKLEEYNITWRHKKS